jgi:hypothetical protein
MDHKKIIEGLFSESKANQIKLGQGVVGKSTYALGAVSVVFAIIAYRANVEFLPWVAGITGGLYVFYYLCTIVYAWINPGPALLEGAHLIQWQKAELSAKHLQYPPADSPVLPDPDTSPKQIQ